MHHRKQLRIHGTSARRMLEALVVAVALLGGGDLSAQQTGQIAGQVTSEDGSPVVRATIRVPGENLQGTTATDGRFVIPRVPAGSYEVEIYALGYGDATQQVQVSAGGVGTLNVQLEVRPGRCWVFRSTFSAPTCDTRPRSRRTRFASPIHGTWAMR